MLCSNIETVDHLFVSCPVARYVWFDVLLISITCLVVLMLYLLASSLFQ
jgi:hypothetical protein